MTLNDLMAAALARSTSYPHERRGQSAYNVAMEHLPDFAVRITGTWQDPFYLDTNLPAFWAAVAGELGEAS